jgi:hypothetical protein
MAKRGIGVDEAASSEALRGWIGLAVIVGFLGVSAPATMLMVELIFRAFGAP